MACCIRKGTSETTFETTVLREIRHILLRKFSDPVHCGNTTS